uniref:Putative secreted protein n=1 Tax=Ixodes ricinus TaxID=34613 RepID=A0A147BLA9_IXORI
MSAPYLMIRFCVIFCLFCVATALGSRKGLLKVQSLFGRLVADRFGREELNCFEALIRTVRTTFSDECAVDEVLQEPARKEK